MPLYPDLPGPLVRTLGRDLAVIALLVAFVWLGVRVHDSVNGLQSVGTGVTATGASVQRTFASAADALGGLPIVGDTVSRDLRAASRATGGQLAALGHKGTVGAHRLAVVVGLSSWAVPTLLLLALVLPRRVREIRRLRELRLALRGPDAVARRRLLAVRAVLTVPDRELLAVSADPAGDLLAGRLDALALAALRSGGVRVRLRGGGGAPERR